MWKFIRNNKILVLSVIYILSPFDFIPEFILGPLGIVDDGVVLVLLLIKAFFDYRKEEKYQKSIPD